MNVHFPVAYSDPRAPIMEPTQDIFSKATRPAESLTRPRICRNPTHNHRRTTRTEREAHTRVHVHTRSTQPCHIRRKQVDKGEARNTLKKREKKKRRRATRDAVCSSSRYKVIILHCFPLRKHDLASVVHRCLILRARTKALGPTRHKEVNPHGSQENYWRKKQRQQHIQISKY